MPIEFEGPGPYYSMGKKERLVGHWKVGKEGQQGRTTRLIGVSSWVASLSVRDGTRGPLLYRGQVTPGLLPNPTRVSFRTPRSWVASLSTPLLPTPLVRTLQEGEPASLLIQYTGLYPNKTIHTSPSFVLPPASTINIGNQKGRAP